MAELKKLTINGVNIIDLFLPVGSIIYSSLSSFNPNDIYGGTWSRVLGRVMIGVDENDNNFKSSGLTGGEKVHTLSVAEIPSHSHEYKRGPIWNQEIGKSYSILATNQTVMVDVSTFQTTKVGGGLHTTIFHLTKLVIFGRELLKKLNKFSLFKEYRFKIINRKESDLLWLK